MIYPEYNRRTHEVTNYHIMHMESACNVFDLG